jgi:hypothetical protein
VHKVREEGVELWAGLKEDEERVPGGTPQYVKYRYTTYEEDVFGIAMENMKTYIGLLNSRPQRTSGSSLL